LAASESAIEIARIAVEAAGDKLGQNITVLDVSERLGIADVFVIVSGASERQVGAIVDEVEERTYKAGHKHMSREGNREDPWVLLDYFETIIHVQHADARAMYSLDRLWKDCPVINLGSRA
jgi:ribosome-associated protein